MLSAWIRPARRGIHMTEVTIARLLLAALAAVQLLAVWERASDQAGWAVPAVFLVLALGCGAAAIAVRSL
jgi:hypothetical protein